MNILNKLIQLSNERTLFEMNTAAYFSQMAPGIAKVYGAVIKDPALIFETITLVQETVVKSKLLAKKWSESAAAQELEKFANQMQEEIAPSSELNKQLERIFRETPVEESELQNGIQFQNVRLQVKRADYVSARNELVSAIEIARNLLDEKPNTFSFKKYWVDRAEEHLNVYTADVQSKMNSVDFEDLTARANTLKTKIESSSCPF
jgi:hypothetical protein